MVRHPAAVATALRILHTSPTLNRVAALTSTVRRFHSEIVIDPDATRGLTVTFATTLFTIDVGEFRVRPDPPHD